MLQTKNLCRYCKYYDYSNHECDQGQYLEMDFHTGENLVTIECEDFEEGEREE